MSASAIVVMIIGMVVIWGGLAASILYAVKKAKEKAKAH
ncbi:methionine/alanine import family NSS transporter small subunit [Virgibacillus soli]|uniref:Methionine/alanine import family NSS transporter small subunit n=1 Tax=Paracerasibacillus soli TaxID=480284 RepID=A0ABU5CQZ2_9BACI|nr:methionine/alanine import family NSS transporter small subunit [Virgibacillus soli]MDY0408795.1 methionine/alanine import family NSS transporter small subunit [Virgibacillus soli]